MTLRKLRKLGEDLHRALDYDPGRSNDRWDEISTTGSTAQFGNLAKGNRERVDRENTQKTMHRREKKSAAYRPSRINNFLFASNEVILHVVGNSTMRGIFIEHYDRTFKFCSITTSAPLFSSEKTATFTIKNLSLLEARIQFLQSGFCYFQGYATKDEANAIITKISNKAFSFNEIDEHLTDAFKPLLHITRSFTDCEKDLALLDDNYAFQINSAKTRYDRALEKWQQDSDRYSHIRYMNARKTLQALHHYLGGGEPNRIFSGKWRHKHVTAVTELLDKYAPIKSKTEDEIPLEESPTVESILMALKANIESNTEKTKSSGEQAKRSKENINKDGDLFAILSVILDYTGVDYFALDIEKNAHKLHI